MLYLLRAHCLAGGVIYFQQKNKSVDLGIRSEIIRNEFYVFCLTSSWKIMLPRLCCKFTFLMKADMKITRNEGCERGKPSYVTIQRLCNFTHSQINLFTVLTMYKTDKSKENTEERAINEMKFPHAVRSISSCFPGLLFDCWFG